MSPTNPPEPTDAQPAPPGRALRLTRLAIALGLFVGVAVFSVLAIQELSNPSLAAPPDNDHLASGALPGDASAATDDHLMGIAEPNPDEFIPIDHEPGGLPVYPGAAHLRRPERQRAVGGVVWEHGVYEVEDAPIKAVLAHYDSAARAMGLALQRSWPTEGAAGGINAAWSDSRRSIALTLLPPEPAAPRMHQDTTLTIVLRYSYTAATR